MQSRILNEAMSIAGLFLVQYAIVAWHLSGAVGGGDILEIAVSPTRIYSLRDFIMMAVTAMSVYAAVRVAMLLASRVAKRIPLIAWLPLLWGIGALVSTWSGELPPEMAVLVDWMFLEPVRWFTRQVLPYIAVIAAGMAVLAIARYAMDRCCRWVK